MSEQQYREKNTLSKLLSSFLKLNSQLSMYESGRKKLSPEIVQQIKTQKQQIVPQILTQLGFDLDQQIPYYTAAYCDKHFVIIRAKELIDSKKPDTIGLLTSITMIHENEEYNTHRQNFKAVSNLAKQRTVEGRPTLIQGAKRLTPELILNHDKVHFWADSFLSSIPKIGEFLIDHTPIGSSIQEYFSRLSVCCIFSNPELIKMLQNNADKSQIEDILIRIAVTAVQSRSRIGIYNKSTFGNDKVPDDELKDFEFKMIDILVILQRLQWLIYTTLEKLGFVREDIGFNNFIENKVEQVISDKSEKIVYFVEQPEMFDPKILNNPEIKLHLARLFENIKYLRDTYPRMFEK